MQGHQRALRGAECGVGDVDERSPHDVGRGKPAAAQAHESRARATGRGMPVLLWFGGPCASTVAGCDEAAVRRESYRIDLFLAPHTKPADS